MNTMISDAITVPAGTPMSGAYQQIHDPGKISEVVGGYPLIEPDAVDGLVESALAAHPGWAKYSALARWEIMKRVATELPVEELARTLVLEQGKTIAEAKLEMSSQQVVLDRYHPHVQWLEENNTSTHEKRSIRYKPYGVCVAITPWNWPYRIACALVIPALLAGNSVILHLSPSAPLAAGAAFRALAEALPEGTLTVLTHPDPEIATRLVGHSAVRKIAFTGSTRVGSLVMANAAASLKSVTLELGGNDPAILLDDVELTEDVIDRLVRGAFSTTGQVCMAIKRLYVPNSRLNEILEALKSRLDREIVGHGLDPSTTMGPLHNQAQLKHVRQLVAQAETSGATVSEHGTFAVDPSNGWYMKPTLVSGLSNDAALVKEEQFGPALPILGYDTVDDAIRMANDSEFGLCSSVWSSDQDRAIGVAEQIEAGTTWINKHGAAAQDPQAPFGGIKTSGVGRIGGRWGLESFLEAHSIIS